MSFKYIANLTVVITKDTIGPVYEAYEKLAADVASIQFTRA